MGLQVARARFLIVFGLCVIASGARADDQRFGTAGQLVLAGSVGAELELGGGSLEHHTVARDVAIDLAPSLLAFVAQDFALGLSLDAGYADRELTLFPYTEVDVALAPGCGFNIPLGGAWSLFPQAWLGFGFASQHFPLPSRQPIGYYDPNFSPPPPQDGSTISGWFATALLPVPVLWRFGSATYLAFGPRARLRFALDKGTRSFSLGLTAGLGGFF